MNCKCIERVDAKLEESGLKYRILPRIFFDAKMSATTALVIETAWVDQEKRTRKKPPPLSCVYCPFCGTRM